MPARAADLRSFAAKIRRWAEASATPQMRAEMEKFAAELEDIAERREREAGDEGELG